MTSMLRRGDRYYVTTANSRYEGEYVGRNVSDGLCFYYLRNEEDEYRATLVIRESERWHKVDVTKIDGSHESLARMAEIVSLGPTTE